MSEPEVQPREHRPGIGRSWCYDDSEWCYDSLKCRCCENETLRALLRRLVESYDRLFDNDPRGRAVEFEAALIDARKTLDPMGGA